MTAATSISTGPSANLPGRKSLVTSGGTTTISDTVVAKIAAVAAREIDGVVDLVTGSIGEKMAGMAQRVIRSDQRGLGVTVEVGQRETAVDINIKIAYGVRIADVAERVRENVIDRIQTMTGLIAKEVNINVLDVDFMDEMREPEERPRVV